MSDNNNTNISDEFIKFNTNELLQELLILLRINTENFYNINRLVRNFLFEYDLDPKNIFEIMTSNPQNTLYYSSLIGFFYQHGIGCKVDKIKAFEIFSNSVRNNQRAESIQISLNQKSESIITFCDDEIKRSNEIILQYFYSLFLYKGIISNRKYNYKLHLKNAEKGDPESQYYVGNYYSYGITTRITKDNKKAFEWYLRSSEGGNIEAICRLGYCYHNGVGITKDLTKAFELYLKSAERGYRPALHMVGECYRNGDGIFKDENKALEWYLKAANKGHGYSQYLVAEYYEDGKFIAKNEEKGFYWNRKAAINGNVRAQFKLAEYYLSNSTNKNEKKAFKWDLKLANVKFLRAIYLTAKCYRDGIGTDKNLEAATKWIKKYISTTSQSKIPITLKEFLDGLDINDHKIQTFAKLI